MRPTHLFLLLLALCVSATTTRASWNRIDSRNVASMDFYNAHLGLVSFADPSHALMRMNDSVFAGIWAAPDYVRSIAIQDTNIAWATVDNKGLYRGDKYWTNWVNTSVRTDQTLIGATPTRAFLTSAVAPQFAWTIDGAVSTATTGIGASDTIVAMDYLTNELVFAVSHTKVFRSIDGGSTWSLGIGGMASTASVFADRVHHIIYAGGDELRMSTDSGKTWTTVYAPPELSSFHELDGQVFGSHDCTGTIYISNGYNHGTSVLRSQTQAQRFEDCDMFPFGAGNIQKGWAFDRGSLVYWWDQNGGCWASRDGLTGLITDSVKLELQISADSISDTLCSATAQPFNVNVGSFICSGIRIDSISVVHALGQIGTNFTPPTLTGNSTTIPLSYNPRVAGFDSVVLRVWFHSTEWGVREHKDIAAIANVVTLPAVLQVVNKLSFGNVHVDSAKTMTLLITNSGCSPMQVDSVVTSNVQLFATASSQMPAIVKRDSSIKIRVTYTPHSVGEDIEAIEIGTDAGHTFVEVDGTGAREVSSVSIQPACAEIICYPNPASNTLFIRSSAEAQSFDMFDMLGRSVLHGATHTMEETIDVSSLPNGIYTLQLGGSRSARVLIQH